MGGSALPVPASNPSGVSRLVSVRRTVPYVWRRYEGDRVAKEVGGKIYFGTVMKFGYIEKDGKDVDAWCVKFDKKIVTYVNSRGKGYKEDFVFEELEAAIELCEKHEEEDK